jgi:enoyl-CoA hydratase/carnithine racemase
MTWEMQGQLRGFLKEASTDPGVTAVVLTGVPGSFCAGTDLESLSATPVEQRVGNRHREGHSDWWPIWSCPKPVVAAVDGAAAGMGAEYATQCDLRLASPGARFGWNFVHRGLVADTGAGTWLLPRLIGVQAASELLFGGEFISAARALQLGYVSAVIASEELVESAVREADRLSRGSPLATALTKELLRDGLSRTADEHLAEHAKVMERCVQSDDHREGVAAFLERREAHFTGT